ncbi:MAG: nicotinamide-nucleotide adenylyltransferase [Candidatus Anstonellales archaeon]
MMKAVFIGRFQPFHKGHLYALKKIAKKYDEIFVIVGSANKSFEKDNPFTLSERIKMLKMVARKNKIRMKIVAIDDVENDEVWLANILKKLKKIDVVFSNNDWVKRIFRSAGYLVKGTGRHERGVNEGTYIRSLMVKGRGWEKHVPAEVADYIKKIGGEERVRKLFLN